MSTTQRAVMIQAYGDADAAQVSTIAKPQAGPGQILVRIRAAGVNGIDWKVRAGLVREVFKLQLPAALGAELAGVVDAVGPGVTRFQPGDRVMGAVGGLGAYAEFIALDQNTLAHTPEGLDDIHAAAMPVAAVAAWKSLHHAGPVRPGQRILIHGAAGGLGGYAVQYAKRGGAEVVATAAAEDLDYILSLGADQVIDHQSQRFEDLVGDIDLVLDYVGGAVLDRSWQVLAPDGVIVGTTSPDILARTPPGRRGMWFMNTPDVALLETLAADVASGALTSRVSEVVGFAEIPQAIERNRTTPRAGKVVADMSR